MTLTSSATIQIQKPIDQVYESIINPTHMTNYFISESNGRLETGKELLWEFPEFPGRYPISNIQVEPNLSVSFVWDPETVVRIGLEAQEDNSTVVKVTEGAKENNEQNLKWLADNSSGWGNFLACMKAYLDHGINLRKGAYDFMRKN